MDATALSPAQLNALATRLARHRDYLARLRARMIAVGFTDADPLATAVRRAHDAAEALYYVTADLERDALRATARCKRDVDVLRRNPPPPPGRK